MMHRLRRARPLASLRHAASASRLSVLLLVLGGGLLSTGCPRDGQLEDFSEEQLATDPVANFRLGVQILERPDRRGNVDHEAAYQRFRDAAELGGGAKAHFNAGWVAEVLHRPADAERHYGRAYEADPSYRPGMFSYARLLVENDKAAEAAEVFRAFVEAHPDDLEVRNELVVALGDAGLYDEAEQQASEVLLRDPENAQVYRNLSSMYHAQGRFGMSQLAIEKALSLDDQDAGTYNNRGVTYQRQGRLAAAIQQYQAALQLEPSHFEANTNLGYIAVNSGDYGLAHETLSQAAQVRPQNLDARLGLAVAHRGQQDFDTADALYEELTRAAPTNRTVYYNAATLHELYTRDYDRALSYLEAFIDAKTGEISPQDDVFARMERVRSAQAEEARRQAEEEARRQAEEERRKRNEALLSGLAGQIEEFEAKVSGNAECLGPDLVEQGMMLVEQASMVIEAEDATMAPDIQGMLDDFYGPMIDEALGECPEG